MDTYTIRYHIKLNPPEHDTEVMAWADGLSSVAPGAFVVSTVRRYNGDHDIALIEVTGPREEHDAVTDALDMDDRVLSYTHEARP